MIKIIKNIIALRKLKRDIAELEQTMVDLLEAEDYRKRKQVIYLELSPMYVKKNKAINNLVESI